MANPGSQVDPPSPNHETLAVAAFPNRTVTMAYFPQVQSCKDIRKCVMSGVFEACLLKAEMIISPMQVYVAANKAIHSQQRNSMVTRNVHTEILHCLSPSKNISESFRSFGASDSDSSLFVAIVDDKDDAILTQIQNVLGTTPTPHTHLNSVANERKVLEAYKISEQEVGKGPAIDAVCTRIVAKEFITTNVSKGRKGGGGGDGK